MCIRDSLYAQLEANRKKGELKAKEKTLVDMIKKPKRSKEDEYAKAQSIVMDRKFVRASEILMRYCEFLKDRSLLISQSQDDFSRIADLLPYLESVLWASKFMNLQPLSEFQNLIIRHFGPQIIESADSGVRVDQELKKCIKTLTPNPIEMNEYFLDFCERNSIDLCFFNQAGHNISNTPPPAFPPSLPPGGPNSGSRMPQNYDFFSQPPTMTSMAYPVQPPSQYIPQPTVWPPKSTETPPFSGGTVSYLGPQDQNQRQAADAQAPYFQTPNRVSPSAKDVFPSITPGSLPPPPNYFADDQNQGVSPAKGLRTNIPGFNVATQTSQRKVDKENEPPTHIMPEASKYQNMIPTQQVQASQYNNELNEIEERIRRMREGGFQDFQVFWQIFYHIPWESWFYLLSTVQCILKYNACLLYTSPSPRDQA
eukprot:TRINITY_DN13675_c0_g1_i2.p1 TRINITY_DN13675_c0_g1~~TRINITY_DN13675_c0_g1_i2.p1  ORF type:complete len:425 (-),score=49.06 TRINITY_DN13675_c0_g1_i2:37-1311(-)